jgi:hypothetical protein
VFVAGGYAVAGIIGETSSNFFVVWLPPVIISIVASAICALTLLISAKKTSVIFAFALLALYAVFFGVFLLLETEAQMRGFIVKPLLFYLAFPAGIGNLVCHIAIRLIRVYVNPPAADA